MTFFDRTRCDHDVPVTRLCRECLERRRGDPSHASDDQARGIRARNLAAIKHELETPMCGHDDDGKCCRDAQELFFKHLLQTDPSEAVRDVIERLRES